MSMNTALSGLTAAQKDIATTSHNIANVGTIGFRGSRAEFADVFSQSPQNVTATQTGSGVRTSRVAQDFTQGSVMATGKSLDLAIEGPGFFALRAPAPANGAPNPLQFSRAGAFGLSADGFIVNGANQQLLGWPAAVSGEALSGALATAQPFQIPFSIGTPQATDTVFVNLRLPSDPAMAGAQAAVPPAAAFDPDQPETWAHRTLIPSVDGMGLPVETELYLVRQSNPDVANPETTYALHLFRDGQPLAPDAGNLVSFDGNGVLAAATVPLAFDGIGGPLTLDLAGSELRDSAFRVEGAQHDGQSVSQLAALDVDEKGTIWATYGAEDPVAQGRFVLANFANPSGLRAMGNASFSASGASGAPMVGVPGASGFGQLRSGALEKANVELTEELVDLISAQRNYQASAKALETSSSMTQTIMNIRS